MTFIKYYASLLLVTLTIMNSKMSDFNQNKVGNGYVKAEQSRDKSYEYSFSTITDYTKNTPKETIPTCLKRLAESNPQFPVLKYKSDPKKSYDIEITMIQYFKQIKKAASSFVKLGLEAKASIGILGFNHPSWFISQLGGICGGGVICGIYTTNTAEICKFIMNDCNCEIIVVENDDQMTKILSILPNVPQLKAIIKYTGEITNEMKNKYSIPIISWSEFMGLDSSDCDEEVERRIQNINPDDCAVLIYTSGTTGFPKGVVLTHDNMIYTVKMAMEQVGVEPFKHCIISYLPLSHIAANLNDIMTTVAVGVTVYFAQPDALKGSLGKTLKEVRPTVFIGVPRVFEKIQEQMQEIGAKAGAIKKQIATWAKKVGHRNCINNLQGKSVEKSYYVAKCFVFNKIKEALGLDRCFYLASAAAPLNQQTLDYFLSLDMPINQVYGLSECTGPHTMGVCKKWKIGSAGTLLNGVEIKIADPDDKHVGEICMRGRNIFKGYYNNVEKTKEAIDSEGWLHTGDLGKMEDGNYLFITGRIKELIITAGGENIAPVPVEDRIKEKIPFISNVMLVGDKQKFVSCLLTLKTDIDPETQQPTNILSPAAVRSLKDIGIEAKTVQDVLECKENALKKCIDDAIINVNTQSVSRAAYVQKWSFLPTDFSIHGGELGPTMKMKRMVIVEKYSNIIDSMYT